MRLEYTSALPPGPLFSSGESLMPRVGRSVDFRTGNSVTSNFARGICHRAGDILRHKTRVVSTAWTGWRLSIWRGDSLTNGGEECSRLWREYAIATHQHFRLDSKLQLAGLSHDHASVQQLAREVTESSQRRIAGRTRSPHMSARAIKAARPVAPGTRWTGIGRLQPAFKSYRLE